MSNDNTRAKDFRYIYAGGFEMVFNGAEGILRFGIQEGQESTLYQQVGVVMSPTTMKLLGVLLSKTVEMMEVSTGTTIPLDLEKVKAVDESLAAASEAAKKKMTTSSPTA